MQVSQKVFVTYGFETVTVGSTVVSLTSNIYEPGRSYEIEALITLDSDSGAIRFRLDGNDPNATTGHELSPGQNLTLRGYADISNFKAIRKGTTNGIIHVSYRRA